MQGSNFLDLEAYVTEWAEQVYNITKTKEQSKISKDNLKYSIDWSKVKFKHGEPDYNDKIRPPAPKGQVIFSTTFVNDTDGDHEYSFKTERSTKSTCEVEMFKGVTTGMSVGINIKTPCEVFEANAGFSRDVEVSRSEGETIERELIWSVDSTIKLPPNTRTTASLIVNQQEFGSKFTMKTMFWGPIQVNVTNRADNTFIKCIEGIVGEIFREVEGITRESNKVVSYISEGKCEFRYGIDQEIKLKQEPLS